MKNNTLIGIVIGAILLMSFNTVTSNLTKRSTSQIIITSASVSYIEKMVNMKYSQGYRVTNIIAQSVSMHKYYASYTKEIAKGEIIVIMEK